MAPRVVARLRVAAPTDTDARGPGGEPLGPGSIRLLDDLDREPERGQVVARRQARRVVREPEQRHHAELRVRVRRLLRVEQRVEVDQVRARLPVANSWIRT